MTDMLMKNIATWRNHKLVKRTYTRLKEIYMELSELTEPNFCQNASANLAFFTCDFTNTIFYAFLMIHKLTPQRW